MNKIFKVIWSKSKQCYIVVSEIAKNKTGKKKIVVASILAALAMAGSMQSVEATIPEGTATGTDAFAIGPQSNVNGAFGFAIGNNAKFNSGTLGFAIGVNSEAKSNQSIAIGYLSKATGRNNGGGGDPALAVGAGANATAGGATAIGMVANASNTFATAIGKSAAASGDSSIAIGQNTTATQEKAIAIGDGSQATDLGTTALGRSSAATGASATALGSLAVANSTSATAVGMQSKATQADTVAIGSSATAAALNSIALGKGASITAPTTGTTLGGQDSIAMGTGASAKQHSSVSVGLGASSDGVRSIAIGPKASATDEDTIAIGSGGVNADKNNQATGANGDSYNSTVAGLSVTNLYYGAKSVDKQSIAIGYTANAKESGIAFGNNAVSDGGGGTAMGKSVLSRNGGVVVGQSSYATGKNSVAYGNTARASGETSTAVGYSTTAEGQNAVAVGYSNTASNKDSVAIGNTNQSTNQGSVTVGYGNNATNDNAVAIGRSTNASGLLSTAIGNGATSQGTYDVAIGSDVTANGSNSVAIGRNAKTSNTSSLAIGVYGTKGTSATGNYSIAMGRDVTASAESAIAIGKDAVSNKKNAVALGSGSDTSSAATAQSSATIAGKSYSWSKGVLSGADLAGMQVSVGKSGAERQIKNVAAGEVSANSTDAINGSQLYAVASGLAKDLKVPYISINSTAAGTGSNVDNDGAKGSNSIAIGPSSTVTNQEGIAIGNGAQSLSDYSIVIGRNAKAETKTGASLTTSSRAIAIGAYSRVASDVTQGVAIGSGSKADEGAVVTGDQSIAIGGNVKVDGHAAIAIGGDDALKAANQQVSYTNTNDTEVTGTLRNAILDLTGYDLSKYKGTTAGHAGVAYGTSALAGNAGVAIGTAANSMTRMNDKGQVVNDKPVTNAVAIGTGARANFDNSVAIGGGSNTDHYATKQVNAVIDGVEVKWSGGENISPGDVVSFGAKGFERQLKNVAPGEVSQTSTDAVNGSQIYSLARKVTNIMNGGSGSVVNVNSLGQPLSKVVTTENGNKVEKYYRTSDIREDGTVPTGTSEQTPTSLALVNVSEPNANLRTTKPRILGNVANGVNDNDAVNVSQLKAATVKYFSVNSTVGDNRNNDKATGTNAIAVGPAAQAAGNNTVSVGYAAGYQADGKNNVGIGTDAGRKLSGDNNISIGSSSGNNSVDNNPNKRTTYTNNSVMLGNEAKVIDSSAQNSIDNVVVIGNRATSSGTSSVVLGTSASGTDKNTIAIGNSSKATSISAVALGNTANATGLNAMALGLNTNASDENSVAIGNTANASAKNTLAMGTNTKALSEAAIALGTNAESSGFGSIAIGEKSKAQPTTATSPAGSVAIGYRTESTGDFAVALGSGNGSYKGASANGVGTVAVGTATVTASGRNFQTVVGFGATTNNVDAAAFGHEAKAYSEKSLALGSGSSATVTGGVALGSGSVANTDKNKKGFDQITGRTDTYAGLKDEAFTSTAGAVSVGDVANKVTRQIIGVAAGTNDTDAVNVAQLKSVNLAFTGNTGNGGDVNLSQSKLAVNGDNQYITTKADGKTLTISGKKQEITVSNGVASASSGMADASNVAQAITQAVSDAKYNWKLSANGQSSTETIAKGDTVDFSGDNNNITVSRTGKNISTKLNETITVDSVNAKKKVTVGTGANQIALDGTLGVATVGASGPNQIIMNGSSGIIQGNKFIGNSFKAGSSLIDNDGLTITNGPSVLATGINAGNKQITGVSSGGTIDTNAANIGDVKKAVANVSQNLNISDGTNNSSVALKNQTLTVTGTGAAKATVSGQTITIDVAKGTLTANADGTATGTAGVADASDVASAINNTNTVLGGKIAKNTQDIATNKANITANKNQITTNTTNIATNTANIAHTIALADDNSTSTTAKSLKDGNVSFNIKGDNKFISTAASSNDVTLTVNEQAIKDAAKSASSFKVKANTHAEEEVKGGDTITFNNGDNIEISQTGKTFTIRTAKNITVDSVTAGNTIINTSGLTNGTTAITGTGVTTDKVTVGGLSIDKTAGINAGGKVISNVASGTVNGNATDDSNAANIGDVKQAVASLSQNLNITDGTNNGTVDLKNQKLNVAGANGVTATVNNQTITVGLDADTVNATTKGLGLTGDTGSTGNKYLKDGDVSFAVTGDGNLVSTTATTAGVKVAVDAAKVKDLAVAAVTVSKDTQADNPITVTPTAGTNSKDYAIGIDTTKLATKTDLTYRANSAADANAKKISLSKGLNFVDGGSTVATVDNDGKVSFDLNTATKNQINTNTTDIATNKGKIATNTTNIAANTTALARNISLGADTGTTSSQSLSTADVAFNVKGATGDFVSTNMNGNTVEISTKRATINSNATTGEASVTGNDGLATAQNVADAINKAADAAKAGAAWNITTNSSTTDKTAVKGGDTVDLVNGDNIEITQDGTDKKKITVATKKDITVDSVTANNKVTVGSGANKITLDGTDGSVTGKAFTGTTFTGTSFTGTSFTAGNTVINTNGLTNGTTAITGTGVTTDNVTVGGISIDKTTGINAGNKVISNVASGGTTATNAANIGDVQNAVANLSQNLNITDGTHDGTVDLKNQKLNVAGANGVTATVNNQTITVGLDADTVNATTKGIGLTADTGSTGNKYLKDGDVSFAVTGDGSLVSTSATAAGVKIAVNSASITAGTDGTITAPTTDGVATAKNVADAINAAKKASKTEITANTGEVANATTGNVTLTSTTAADGHTIYDVKLNDKVTLGTGANAVTIDGTTGAITGKTATIGGVTVNGTANTIGGLSNTTWNGTAVSGRAATEDQLKAVADAAGSQTWEITADKDAATSGAQTGTKKNAKVGKDDKVQLIAGENLTVNQNERDFTYSLNKDLVKMNSATFEATGGKTTVIKGDSIVQTDGTNVNTSNATSNTITDGTNTSTITAGKAQIGTVGIDGVASKISTGGTNAVVVNGADGTIKTGNVTVTGGTTNDITGLSNTTLTATDFATKGRAATEEQLKAATGATTLKFTGDVATNTGSVNLKDDTFGIKGDGKYISTDVNGKNVNLTVSEAEVKKSAVAAVTVSTDTTDANNPLTVTPTTSADGTTKDYKVTIDGTKIANKTNLSYKANDGTAKQVSLADGLNFKNGTLTTASIDDNGVVKYDVNTASITAGTDGTITGPTTDGVATAQNVADAINAAKKASKTEITANTGEAANATTGNVTLTSTTAADGHTIYDVKLNDKVTLGTGANAVTIDGTTGAITGKTATIGGVTVNGTANTIGGLSNTTWNGTATTGRAATEDQLKAVADAASSQTWNITADKAGTTGNQTGTKKNATVGKDETVELVAGDNLTINQNERKFTYSLNKDLAGLTSVSIGTGTTETIKLDGATGKITAKNAVIGGVTVDGDNNHVTGLANTTWNGTATTGRAATEDQLKAVAETAKTTTDAVNLKFSGNTNTSPGVVNLKDDTLGIVGDGKYVSTDANGKNLTVKVSEAEVKKSAVAAVTVSTDTTDANNPISVTPTTSADGTTKDYKVTIDGTKIANKTNLSYKANGGTVKQVSLADGLNFKNGTLTTASIDDAGVVKYDVNTASITAGADGTITGPTTDGVATAQNVADAINAAKKASKTEITANTGEAANATTGNVTLTSTTAADGHTIYDVKLNDKVTLGSGANAVTIDGTAGKATIGSSVINGVNNTFTTGGAKAVTLDGATG
ncbi:MAG: ESPR-type extended signal peptide-containing protein, partial [Veillonella sp.]|nr:ESPR-type extended signal peptide-containing protein [Veillonella sp.]